MMGWFSSGERVRVVKSKITSVECNYNSRYRVVQYGRERFAIQSFSTVTWITRKLFRFETTVEGVWSPYYHGGSMIFYKSAKKAEEFAKKEWGASRVRDYDYKVV